MRRGGRPVVPASRAFAHADALLAAHPGLTMNHLCRLAGVSHSSMSGARRTMRLDADTSERILAVAARHVALSPPPQVPVSFAREHVDFLLAETGLTPHAISRASGLNYQTIYNVLKPSKRYVMQETHAALLACTPDDIRGVNFWTDRWPTIVRLRALQANGWPMHYLGPRVGMNLSVCVNSRSDSPIERTVERRIKNLYDAIGDEPGPSASCVGYATRLGFKTPIHYDEDMNLIAEPEPADDAQEKARTDLCILGLSIEHRLVPEIATALGCDHRRVSRVRRRHGLRVERAFDGAYECAETWPGAISAIRRAVRDVHHRSTIDALDAPGLDYVDLLASLTVPDSAAA